MVKGEPGSRNLPSALAEHGKHLSPFSQGRRMVNILKVLDGAGMERLQFPGLPQGLTACCPSCSVIPQALPARSLWMACGSLFLKTLWRRRVLCARGQFRALTENPLYAARACCPCFTVRMQLPECCKYHQRQLGGRMQNTMSPLWEAAIIWQISGGCSV